MPAEHTTTNFALRGRIGATRTPIVEGGLNEVYKELAKYPPLRDMSTAACKGKNGDYWGEVRSGQLLNGLPPHTQYALTLCSTCPVIESCAKQWVDDRKPAGVYAGHLVQHRTHKVIATYMDVIGDPTVTPPPKLSNARLQAFGQHNEPVSRDVCGGHAGTNAHARNNESFCEKCKAFQRERNAKYKKKSDRVLIAHGTLAARQRHRRANEPYCNECRPKGRVDAESGRTVLAPHGTSAARKRHRTRGEAYCDECVKPIPRSARANPLAA